MTTPTIWLTLCRDNCHTLHFYLLFTKPHPSDSSSSSSSYTHHGYLQDIIFIYFLARPNQTMGLLSQCFGGEKASYQLKGSFLLYQSKLLHTRMALALDYQRIVSVVEQLVTKGYGRVVCLPDS